MYAVGILVFDLIEVLDFAGPYEVFTTAARVHSRLHPDNPKLFDVFTVGETLAPAQVRAGLRVLPDHEFNAHPIIDVLIVPGGVISVAVNNSGVIGWIKSTAAQCSLAASVCTGAFLLAKAGLLDGKQVTTHWEDQDDLRKQFPTLTVEPDVRWIDTGHIITSAGISAGMDMCLHIVERLAGRALAEATARQMEYVWTET
jgi:transcriptional regulator GlxA family with amidase domain